MDGWVPPGREGTIVKDVRAAKTKACKCSSFVVLKQALHKRWSNSMADFVQDPHHGDISTKTQMRNIVLKKGFLVTDLQVFEKMVLDVINGFQNTQGCLKECWRCPFDER